MQNIAELLQELLQELRNVRELLVQLLANQQQAAQGQFWMSLAFGATANSAVAIIVGGKAP